MTANRALQSKPTPAHPRLRLSTTLSIASLWFVLALVGCGDDDGAGPDAGAMLDASDVDAQPDGHQPDAEQPDANTSDSDAGPSSDGGVIDLGDALLQVDGDDSAIAADALPSVEPLSADDALLLDDRRIANRVTIVLDPTATVGGLNAALSERGLGIAYANPPSLVVTLVGQPLASHVAAQALVDGLVNDGVALSGYPAYRMGPDVLPGSDVNVFVDAEHLLGPRFFGAWNLRDLANDSTRRLPVMVLDTFYSTDPSAQLPNLRFTASSRGFTGMTRSNLAEGNHGFWVAGIIGASFDSVRPTGTSPNPDRLLDLIGIDAAHLDTVPLMRRLGTNAPLGQFIVNASYGYNDPDFDKHPMLERALGALELRDWLRAFGDNALLVASSGNDGEHQPPPSTELNSPLTTQARIADLRTLFTAQDRDGLAFLAEWNRRLDIDERVANVLGHTLIVGAAQRDGSPRPSSTPGHDVRMVGEQVEGPCVAQDLLCSPMGTSVWITDGTSGAAPAAAGAAAYLMALAPDLSPAAVRQSLIDAQDGDRWVDVFRAALSLEENNGIPVRPVLVDVTGGDVPGTGDGVLDRSDLSLIVDALNTGDGAARERDYSRFDLNGDGFTRTDTEIGFDLDASGADTLGTVSFALSDGTPISFNETRVSDLDVLCFVAYGGFYTGDTTVRDELLADACANASDRVVPAGTWTGTVSYSVLLSGAPEGAGCGMAGSRPQHDIAVALNVECPPFDPLTTVGSCHVLGGTVNASISHSLITTTAAVEVFGGAACATDAECGGNRCVAQDRCMFGSDPLSAPGLCSACEAYATNAVNASDSMSASLVDYMTSNGTMLSFVGTAALLVGTTVGGAGARVAEHAIPVELEGTSTRTIATAGSCGPLVPGMTLTSVPFGIDTASATGGVIEATVITPTLSANAISGTASGTDVTGVEPQTTIREWSATFSLTR